MANIWMRGLKLSNPSALRNLNFVQRGLPFVSKGHTGGDADLGEKTTNILTRKRKYASGGLIHLFSTAATARMKDPPKPPINKGDPGQHNNQPVKGPKQPPKETVSDRQEEAEAKNK